MSDAVDRALAWIGVPSSGLRAALDRYADWLRTEALPAGGVGPGEPDRLSERHIADSLLFAGVWERDWLGPVCDVGTGVGLPGIPLALAHPMREFVLIDRAGRRVDLARRAVRVLGIDNVRIERADLADLDLTGFTVVARASLPPPTFRQHLLGGPSDPHEVLLGGSHVRRPVFDGFETIEIPREILDRKVWVLRMIRS